VNANPPANPLGLPASTASAVRQITDDLFRALHDPMIADYPGELPAVRALWWITKMLNAITGSYDSFGDIPEADLPRAQWEEVLANTGDVAAIALNGIAAGKTPEKAADWIAEHNYGESEAWQKATAYSGTLEMVPPDHGDTTRILSVAFDVMAHYTPSQHVPAPSVTADRGPAPEPRPHTASTVLRAGWHLAQLAAVLGEIVIEPAADGIPLCGREDKEVTCEVCERDVGADVARVVQADRPWHHEIRVCSVPCARAASAGEHRD
jgi:hypothetical protein